MMRKKAMMVAKRAALPDSMTENRWNVKLPAIGWRAELIPISMAVQALVQNGTTYLAHLREVVGKSRELKASGP
jgi:hypothetical protein